MKRIMAIIFSFFVVVICMGAGGILLSGDIYSPSEIAGEIPKEDDETVTANANKYHLHFNANGGTITKNSAPYKCSHGMLELTYNATDYNRLDDIEAARSGYIFNGWYSSSSGGTLLWNFKDNKWSTNVYVPEFGQYLFKTSSAVNNAVCAYNGANGAIITVYAHWIKINTRLYFDANGGTITENTAPYVYADGMPMLTYHSSNYNKMADIKVARAGYIFEGWYSAVSGGVLIWDLAEPYNSTNRYVSAWGSYLFQMVPSVDPTNPVCVLEGGRDTIYVYARWTPRTYTVSFAGNGGAGEMSSRTWAYDGWYTVTNGFTRTGYTFVGWDISTGESNTPKNYGSSMTNYLETRAASFTDENKGTRYYRNLRSTSGNVTFKARWAVNQYTVNLTAADIGIISLSGGGTYNYGSSVTVSAKVADGYTFERWSDGNTSPNRTFTLGTANIFLTAYSKPNNYTVSFDANGGSCPTASKNVTFGSTYGSLPSPTRANYTFESWNRKKNYIDMDDIMSYFNGFLSSGASTRVIKESGGVYSWEGQAGTLGPPDYIYRLYSLPLSNGATYRLSYTARSSENGTEKTTSLAPRKKDNSDWYGNAYYDLYVTNDTTWRKYQTTFKVDSTYGGFSFGNWWGATRTYFKDIVLERIDVDDYEAAVESSSTYTNLGDVTLYAKWIPIPIENSVKLRVISKDGSAVSASNLGGTVRIEGYQIFENKSSNVVLTSGQTENSAEYVVHKGQAFKLTALPNSGYVFVGFSTNSSPSHEIKNPASRVTETATYYPTSGTTYYVYFKQMSGNILKYDETYKYFYFEDGYYPQSDANFEIERMNFSKSFNKTGTAICSDGILTLNGSGATPSPTFTWKRDKFWAGQEYLIDIKLLSGSVSGYGRFVFETRKANNVVLSQRHNLDVRFQTGSYVFSFNQIDENEAKEFEFWIWEDSNLVFNNAVFKIEI